METLFLNLLALTGPVSALIALLLALTPLMQKSYAAKWRQYMWAFCALRLLFPVKLFSSSLYTIELPVSEAPQTAVSAAQDAVAGGVKPITVLAAVWLLGAAVFTLYQAISYIAFRRSVTRRGAICSNPEIVKIFTISKAAMGIRRKIGLRVCKTLKSPMITGFIHPVLLLPHDDYDADAAEIIIRHELIHFKKRHLWYKLLLLLTESVSWFNPFVYLMFRAAQKDMELACDDEVIRGTDGDFRRRYCETILSGIHRENGRANPLTTCLNVNKKILMDRFGNILNTGVKKNGVFICLAVSISLIAGGAVVSFAEEKVSDELTDAFDYAPVPVADIVKNAAEAIIPTEQPESGPDVSDPAEDYGGYASDDDYSPENSVYDEADATAREPERAYAPAPEYADEGGYISEPEENIPEPENASEPEENVQSGAEEPYPDSQSVDGYTDISIDGSRSFEGEEITNDNSRTITVETDGGDVGDDSFTAYIRAGNDGYEMIRSEDEEE